MPPKKAAGPRKKAAPRKGGTRSRAREQEHERRKQRRALRWRVTIVTALLVVLAAVVLLTRGDDDDGVIAGIEASGTCAYDKVTDEDPPAAGDVEDVEPARPGFYEPADEAPSDLGLLRAMRQGFVVLWYDPKTSLDPLQAISDRFGRDLILVPRPGMARPVALTAWGRRALCTAPDETATARFVEAFRDQGPEKGFL